MSGGRRVGVVDADSQDEGRGLKRKKRRGKTFWLRKPAGEAKRGTGKKRRRRRRRKKEEPKRREDKGKRGENRREEGRR